jgi:hypothetical protein
MLTLWQQSTKRAIMTRKTFPYGFYNFRGNGADYGCCPGHDKIFLSVWKTRTCETTKRLKRYPKKVERRKVREELRKNMDV